MVLEYIEKDFDETGRRVGFEQICPQLSGTIEKQTKTIDPPGLTVVAIIEEVRPEFELIFNKLRTFNFKVAPKLHLTLLGLFGETNKSNPDYVEQAIKQVKDFFNNVDRRKQFGIKLDIIRPGTYYKDGTRDQMDCLSDGTVFARGDIRHEGTRRFQELGRALSNHLHKKLSNIFDDNFKPKFNAVWCTLGYFNCNEFWIDLELEAIFSSSTFSNFNLSIPVKELHIMTYKNRTLEDAKCIECIVLN